MSPVADLHRLVSLYFTHFSSVRFVHLSIYYNDICANEKLGANSDNCFPSSPIAYLPAPFSAASRFFQFPNIFQTIPRERSRLFAKPSRLDTVNFLPWNSRILSGRSYSSPLVRVARGSSLGTSMISLPSSTNPDRTLAAILIAISCSARQVHIRARECSVEVYYPTYFYPTSGRSRAPPAI